MTSQFVDFFNCDIDNRLNLNDGMWKTFDRVSNEEQLTEPMCFKGA